MFFERRIERLRPGTFAPLSVNRAVALLAVLAASLTFLGASPGAPGSTASNEEEVPALLLEGGRRLEFVRSFSSEMEVKPKRSLWNKIVDFVAGPPVYRRMARPYDVALDSVGRIIVTDPGAPAVHILDFEKQKYSLLEGGKGQPFRSPLGVAVDAKDNIYVTDSALGIVFVFDSGGKFRRYIGRRKDGAGSFQRPTGIAVDSTANRLYVTDTLQHRVYALDLAGNVVSSFGGRGLEPGRFNFPTEIALRGRELLVVDAMNFRVQTFTREGVYVRSFGALGERTGTLLRPKGLALDSEGNIYVADALLETVQVFNEQGQLLYYFGSRGVRRGEFQLPAGLSIDPRDRIYVADSLNQRVQVFQFTPRRKAEGFTSAARASRSFGRGRP
jgi:DNA-binding beta-propeller fold protein YncE